MSDRPETNEDARERCRTTTLTNPSPLLCNLIFTAMYRQWKAGRLGPEAEISVPNPMAARKPRITLPATPTSITLNPPEARL
jgi:hypothetical protein